jgi:hypothetical protein
MSSPTTPEEAPKKRRKRIEVEGMSVREDIWKTPFDDEFFSDSIGLEEISGFHQSGKQCHHCPVARRFCQVRALG